MAALEDQSTGAWDVIRWPFMIVLIAVLCFFFAAQQELSKTVLGVLTAAATVLPTVVKVASVFGDRSLVTWLPCAPCRPPRLPRRGRC